ncbi:MAG: hypothetical protein FWG96_00090 [Methanomassiliicoccaceae archaeon]|nr:hypothetical protein [Methanomassiliicoccaceae archaeon]
MKVRLRKTIRTEKAKKTKEEIRGTVLIILLAAGAAVSAAVAAVSIAEGNTARTAVSLLSFIILAACAVSAWLFRARLSALNKVEKEIKCLRLKKPGIDKTYEDEILPKPHDGGQDMAGKRYEEEIVPKGKMPDKGR